MLQMKLLLGLLWTDMLVRKHSHGLDWDLVHIFKKTTKEYNGNFTDTAATGKRRVAPLWILGPLDLVFLVLWL